MPKTKKRPTFMTQMQVDSVHAVDHPATRRPFLIKLKDDGFCEDCQPTMILNAPQVDIEEPCEECEQEIENSDQELLGELHDLLDWMQNAPPNIQRAFMALVKYAQGLPDAGGADTEIPEQPGSPGTGTTPDPGDGSGLAYAEEITNAMTYKPARHKHSTEPANIGLHMARYHGTPVSTQPVEMAEKRKRHAAHHNGHISRYGGIVSTFIAPHNEETEPDSDTDDVPGGTGETPTGGGMAASGLVPISLEQHSTRVNGEAMTAPSRLLAATWQPTVEADESWFQKPQLDGPTPFTVTDEGKAFGHIALWGACHVGHSGSCVQPPRSKTGYSFFTTGVVRLGEKEIPVGSITIGTGHAGLQAGAHDAAAHYDNTGAAVVDVAAFEDEYGIAVAGMVRPGTTYEQIHALRASALSGDWRKIGSGLELIAVLAVNVPGFPIARTALAASAMELSPEGEVVALIAMGQQGITPTAFNQWMQEMENRMQQVEYVAEQSRPLVASAMLHRVKNKEAAE